MNEDNKSSMFKEDMPFSDENAQNGISSGGLQGKLVSLIMKASGGAIKSERQAIYVLLGLVVVIFAISFYLFFGGAGSKAPINPSIPPAVEQNQSL